MKKRAVIPVFLSLFTELSIFFILYAWFFGTDDIISIRELLFLGMAGTAAAAGTFLISRHLPKRTLLLTIAAAVLTSAALNFEFTDLMRLPLQLPADNSVKIAEIEEGTEISMTWAYWFRPRTQTEDPFLTNPDRDISFSQLKQNGTWNLTENSEGPMLSSTELGASIGISGKPRALLAVLCFKVSGGDVTLDIPWQADPIRITPDMTENQPYRMIMKNGLIRETAGNIIQIIFWSGSIMLCYLIGITVSIPLVRCAAIQRKALIYCLAFLIPCVVLIFLCIILKITPFGEKTFLYSDMWSQYADYMAYLRSIARGENDLFYSFSLSLGDELTGLLAYYMINPLNWLVCLFPEEKLPLAVSILVIVRYGICGLTAAVYFVKRRNCSYSALLFSTCYAMMSYNVVNTENTCLREGAMVLPLVILGIEQLVEGKSVFIYLLSLAAAIFLNYYSGYQICIFAAIFFVCHLIAADHIINIKKTIIRFLGTSILAAGICAFLLIPVVIQLGSGPKGLDPSIFGFRLNMPWTALFGKLLVSAYDIHEISVGYPNLYIGLAGVLLIPLYFFNREISNRKKASRSILLLACILILQINPLNLVLHGFSEPIWWPFRYSFIISFFMLMTAQESFHSKNGWTPTAFAADILLGIGLTILLLSVKYSWMSADSIKVNTSIAAAVLILLAFGIRKNIRFTAVLLGLLTITELFINASHTLIINTAFERSNTTAAYAAYYDENDPIIRNIQAIDHGFFRIEKTYWRTQNDPMLFGYNGLSHYSSTLSNDLLTFLPKAGFRRYIPHYRIIYAEGSDIAMDSLLGIKYLISGGAISKPYPGVFSMNSHTVFENPYALPVMFTASEDLPDMPSPDEKSGFEFQNDMFSALTGEKINIYTPAFTEGPSADGMIIQKDGSDTCYLNADENQSGVLGWNITAAGTDTLYAFFPADQIHTAAISLSGSSGKRPLGYYFDNSSYHILHLGSFSEGEMLHLEMVPVGEEVCLGDAQFYHENLSELQRAVSILKQDETSIEKVKSSYLKGTFTASSEKSLFFTIPYNKGWTVKIDGKTVPVSKVFDVFMAVPVSKGDHTMEMRFIPCGLFPGIVISLVSFAAAVIVKKKETVFDQ